MNNLDILRKIPDSNIDGEEKVNALKSAFSTYNKIAQKLRKDELENIIIYLMDYVDFEEVKRNSAKWQNHSFPQYRWHDLRKNPDDLPDKDGKYFVYANYSEQISPNPDDVVDEEGYFVNTLVNGDWAFGYLDSCNVIAWREIEPFKGDDY